MKMFCVRGGAFQASRALRAEHENAGLRQIAFGDWERGVVAGFEASLHPPPPPRPHPPGYAEVPRHENRTKSHERTACRERTISFTPAARAFPRSLGAKSISCPFVRLSCPAALRKPRRGGGCGSGRGRARSSPLTLARTPIGRQADSAAGRVFVVRAKRP